MTPEQSALTEAIEIAGGQSELARKISLEAGGLVKQQQVWNWLHREKKAPIKHTVSIEKLTGVPEHRAAVCVVQREAVQQYSANQRTRPRAANPRAHDIRSGGAHLFRHLGRLV